MTYKLLVIDIDGTLIGKDGIISTQDREALAKACHSGVQVSLSTGRASQACLWIIDQLDLDGYHMFFDGALVSDPSQGKEVYSQPLSKVVVKQMVELAHRHNIDLELYSATHYFAERETWSTKAHREFFNIEPTIVDSAKFGEQDGIIKGMVVATNPEELEIASSFCRRFDGSLHFSWVRTPAYSGIDFINIVAPEVSKGKALVALALHLGVSLGEVIAIGDGINDIPLFSTAGLAIAMDNAPDEVKATADHITLDVSQSGLAVAISQFLL